MNNLTNYNSNSQTNIPISTIFIQTNKQSRSSYQLKELGIINSRRPFDHLVKTHHNSQNMAISHTFDVSVSGEESFPTNLLILMIVSDFTLSNSILHGFGPR